MKTKLFCLAAALLFSFFVLPLAFGQGALAPPGSPAPTMKTLDQIEARTLVNAANTPGSSTNAFIIAQPGSYYLGGNITVTNGNAITIVTNGVTLDLNGFTISSTAPSAAGNGILLNSGLKNITIANGFIQGGVTNDGSGTYSGSGFSYGLYCVSALANAWVSRISVSGCRLSGIYLNIGNSTVVESCTVRTVGGIGISASTIKSSVAVDCGSIAIYGDQVSDSRGESSFGYGVDATATAQNCYGSSDGNYGLYSVSAQNCYGSSDSGTGLYAATTAQNCYGHSYSGSGLYAVGTAIGCNGYSASGARGLYAQNASFCSGYRVGGRAIEATVANGCYAVSGTNLITYKYNMP